MTDARFVSGRVCNVVEVFVTSTRRVRVAVQTSPKKKHTKFNAIACYLGTQKGKRLLREVLIVFTMHT